MYACMYVCMYVYVYIGVYALAILHMSAIRFEPMRSYLQ